MIDKWLDTIKDMIADAKDLWSDFRHKHKRKILIGLIAVSLLAIPALTQAGPAVPTPYTFTINYDGCGDGQAPITWDGGLIEKVVANDNGDGSAAVVFALRSKNMIGVDGGNGELYNVRGGDRYKTARAMIGTEQEAFFILNTNNSHELMLFYKYVVNSDLTVDYWLWQVKPLCG